MIEFLLEPDSRSLMAGLATLVAATVGSFTALIVAFWAYPWQKSRDRRVEEHKERRQLYRSFISQIESVLRVPLDLGWSHHEDVRQLWALKGEIQLFARQAVRETSADLVVATNSRFMDEAQTVTSSDGKERSHFENIAFARKQLVDAMRNELKR
ncbi:hypothetical protein [Ruegeria sp. HKCCA6837]|uniref:hypothetical protein n=1 Tax=Ruegeria sp. HKCCA6837 TaxID=2682989 RepID=UPI001487C02B|nr:hypothetical protein [Ruegeria sp. HKCCA6837]